MSDDVTEETSMRLAGVEGIDCSGKTTLVAALAAALDGRGANVATHREPGDGPIGRLFRELSCAGGDHDPAALALLSAADRRDQQPALARLGADLVISDRYYLSGLAYHAADGFDPLAYQRLNHGVRRPDLYLFLDISPAAAAARRQAGPPDRWERGEITARLPACYEQALRLVQETEGAAVTRLDATRPPRAVVARALQALAPLLAMAAGGARG
jgi:dTMP kinase